MSASSSSTQLPVETKEAVKDVKPTKPPIKPKPFVPPKPKQAFISTNSENKGPPLSPGPCSPTTDIPSAFKISQLTGPQPYGARRTSLRRWSSSVGEEVPLESNTLLSPVENVMPELYNKVTTQPLAAAAKHLQTGSVWKGKSPFMLTTRGWGEQKSQGKDIHESGLVPQKPTINSDSKDVDLKETVPEGNTVVNSSSPSRSILSTDHKEVQTNVQDLKPKVLSKAPEEVKKTPLEDSSSGKSKIIEISAPDNEPKKSQESSNFSDSPQTDAYFGITKQSTQCEPNKPDTKTVDLSDQSGLVTTGGTQDHDKASVQWKNSQKDIEGSQLIPPVPKPRPRSNILVKESTKTIEESPSSDPSNLTAHEVYRHHEDIPELKPEIQEEKDAHSAYLQTSPSQIRVVSQNRDQEILPKLETGEKPEISSITQITDEDKKGTVSTEHKLLYTAEDYHEGKAKVPSDNHNKHSHEDKKIVAPTDLTPPSCTVKANEIYSKGQETTCTQVHDYNIEEDQPKNRQHEYDDTVRDESKSRQHEYDDAVWDPSKNRQHKYDDAIRDESKDTQQEDAETIRDQSKNSQQEYDDTIQDPSKSSQHEEDDTKWDPSKNRQHEYDDTIQTGENVPYETEVSEKHTEHPSEYRFFENNEDLPYYSKIPSAPELPGPTDTEAISNLCVGSQIVKNANLISGDLFSYSADESHIMDKGDQPRKPHDDLDLLQRHGSSRPELSYDESHFRYSEVVGMSQQNKLSDYNEQSDLLDYYTSQSPVLNECEVHPKKIEFGADELHMPQHGQSQPQKQEFTDAHKVELDYKKSGEQVHKYDQSEESDYKYQELKKSVHKYEQPDKSTVKYEQLEESDQRSEPSEEPEYRYELSQEPMSRHQQPWGSDLKDEEKDKSTVKYESGQRSEPSKEPEESGQQSEPSKEPEEFDQRSEPSMEPEESGQRSVPSKEPEESDQRSEPSMEPEESDQRSEPSKKPEYTYELSQESLSRYQQPWGSELKDEETDKSTVKYEKSESHNRSEPSEEPEYTYEQSQDPMSRYQQPWGSDLKDDKSAVKSEQLEESDQRSEPSKEPEFTYEQSQEEINRWGSDHKYNQTEESGHRHEKLEHSMGQYELLEQPSYGHEKSEEEVHKNDRSEEFVHVTSPPAPNLSSNTYSSPEESEHRYAYFEEKVHTMEELKYPVPKFEQLDEPSEYEQSTKPIQGYQISEKPVYRFKESEEIIPDQSQETDYKYVQHYESTHCDELVSQRERTEDPTYVHTGSDAKNSQVESLQRPSESNLRNSEIEKPTCVDSLTEEIHDSKKTSEEQVHIHTLPGGQQLQGVHEEETRHAESEEDQHVDDLTEWSKEELPAIKTDDSKLEEIQDQEAKTYPVLNGHAEDSVDSTSDAVKEIHTEEPEETQAEEPHAENFDFLEGTVVLDSSFMRGKASLGKKRGHRIPVGTCDAEEKDPEYWMFRDSTEPKIISEKQSDEDEKERQVDEHEKDEASPNSSQSPVKSPHKKGIFAGIISPSLLKGRLKNRSKTMDDEMVRPEAEESKSPGKEKPESPSHSLNWLQALKKKKKSSKETTKEEKKKQPK